MIRKLASIVTLLLWSWSPATAQNLKGNVGLGDSHKAGASKGTAGGDIVNVDLFTGTASVSIPIFDYSVDGVNGNVSVNYMAKGIKVDEIASSAGLGWNLSAGGSITREVMGLEDEVTLPTVFSTYSTDHLQGNLVPGANISPDTSNVRTDDLEHDVFHFDFGGRSLDVVFAYKNDNLVFQTYPKSEIKIDMVTWHNGSTSSGIDSRIGTDSSYALGFVVTDEAGNTFDFKQGDIEFKEYGFNPGDFSPDSGSYYAIKKWDLISVRTYTGLKILYEYRSKYVEYVEAVTEILYPKSEQYDSGQLVYDPLEIKEQKWIGIKTHLSKIIYPNNIQIDINTDTNRCDVKGDYRINNMTLRNEYNSNYKNEIKYSFNYAYFNTPMYGCSLTEISDIYCSLIGTYLTSIPSGLNADSAKQKHYERGIRLKLKSIERKTVDNSIIEPYYSFEYNTNDVLPYRFYPQKDYYGYYNYGTVVPHERSNLNPGGPYNDVIYTSIPYPADPVNTYSHPTTVVVQNNIIDNTKNFGADRSYNFTTAQACVLKKIKNCSNGEIELQYQNYTLINPTGSYGCIYYNPSGCDSTVDSGLQGQDVNDGLCIGKVIRRDSFNTQTAMVTEYTLADGQRFNRGGYCWYPDPVSGHKIYTNYFVGQHEYYNGSNHGFSTVTVTNKGLAANNIVSQTRYTFSNLMYQESSNTYSNMERPTGLLLHELPSNLKQYRLGLPLTISQLEDSAPVSTTTNTYEYLALPDSIYNYKINNHNWLGWWRYLVVDYKRSRLKEQTTTTYINDIPNSILEGFTSTVEYSYDIEDNLTCKKTTDSKGNIFKEYSRYTHSGGDESVLDLGDVQHLVSQEIWRKVGSNDSVLLSCALNTTEGTFSGPPYPQTYKLRQVAGFSAKLKTPLTASQYHATGSGKFIDKSEAYANNTTGSFGSVFTRNNQHTRFDKRGNAVETKIDDRKYVSTIFDAQNATAIATAQNAKIDEIAYSSFEGDYSDTAANNYTRGNLVFDPNAVVQYSSVGISKAVTGKYVYELDHNVNDIRTEALPENTYVLSFWSYNTGAIDAAIMNGTSQVGTVSLSLQNTVGNWRLLTGTFNAGSGDYVKIMEPNGTQQSTTYIDDLRLHPIDATMTSQTYAPLFGKSSSTDESNYIMYYDYDVFGRRTVVRDMRGNILVKQEIVCNGSDSESTGGGNPNSNY